MSRLVKEKGCHILIKAYNKLNTNKTLIIAGDNNHKEKYTEDLKKQASDNIKFFGFVDGQIKEELLSNAYCFILPSTLESMPLSLLEAMSYGNCVIASDLPQINSIMRGTGLLFKTGSEDDLAHKLNFIL